MEFKNSRLKCASTVRPEQDTQKVNEKCQTKFRQHRVSKTTGETERNFQNAQCFINSKSINNKPDSLKY